MYPAIPAEELLFRAVGITTNERIPLSKQKHYLLLEHSIIFTVSSRCGFRSNWSWQNGGTHAARVTMRRLFLVLDKSYIPIGFYK